MDDLVLPKNADLDDFLSRVDMVEALIRGLKEGSIDPATVPDSPDDVLGNGASVRVTADRTLITGAGKKAAGQNGAGGTQGDKPAQQASAPSQVPSSAGAPKKKGPTNYAAWERFADGDDDTDAAPPSMVGPEGESFMRHLEADAAERRARKDAREKEAEGLKAQGNAAFKAGRFDEAVDRYSDAIERMPYSTVLLTNRAQAYHRLGDYRAARSDCDRALDIDPRCVKARVRRGLAHHCEGRYAEALADFAAAVKIDPSAERDVRAYIETTEHSRQLAEADQAAREALEGGKGGSEGARAIANAVGRLLASAASVGEVAAAAVACKAALLGGDAQELARRRAAFRVSGGLGALTACPAVARYAAACAGGDGVPEGRAVAAAVLDLLDAACTDDATNQSGLAEAPGALAAVGILAGDRSPLVAERALQLLATVTRSPRARGAVVQHEELVRRVFERVMGSADPFASALYALSHLCLEAAVRERCVERFSALVPRLVDRAADVRAAKLCAPALAALGNMAMDAELRARFREAKCVERIVALGATTAAGIAGGSAAAGAAESLLALMLNLSLDEPALALLGTSEGVAAVVGLARADESVVRQRAATLLARLAKSESVAAALASDDGMALVVRLCEDPDAAAGGVRCFAACTQRNPAAWQAAVRLNAGATLVRALDLAAKGSQGDALLANAALALANCAQNADFCEKLVGGDCVARLVELAKREPGPVQENAAVALARLARGNPAHLERLRALGAIEILHTRLAQSKSAT